MRIGVRGPKTHQNPILERNDFKVQVSSKQGQVGSLRYVGLSLLQVIFGRDSDLNLANSGCL